jgi:hypothetical protein
MKIKYLCDGLDLGQVIGPRAPTEALPPLPPFKVWTNLCVPDLAPTNDSYDKQLGAGSIYDDTVLDD